MYKYNQNFLPKLLQHRAQLRAGKASKSFSVVIKDSNEAVAIEMFKQLTPAKKKKKVTVASSKQRDGG